MTTIFDKKIKLTLPKRTILHKMHIGLTFVSGFSLINSIFNHNVSMAFLNGFCLIFWIINWYISSKKHKIIVEEYKEKAFKEQQELNIKNAFNFSSYPHK